MSPTLLSLVAAVLAAAAPEPGGVEVASLNSPVLPDMGELVEQALPPPPETVLLQTHYYGTVTVNHAAHLKRNARCKDCHGPGPVRPIEFTPKIAHERCIGCHDQRQKGPTKNCKGCHNLTAQPVEAGALPPAAPADGSAPGQPPAPDARPVARPGPPVIVVATAEDHAYAFGRVDPDPEAIDRSIQLSGLAGSAVGASVRVTSLQSGFIFSQAVERLASGGQPRTSATLGAGAPLRLPLIRTLRVVAEGLVGVDAVDLPTVRLFPVIGARAGLEWSPHWMNWYPLIFSVSGFRDLFHGGESSPFYAFATIGVGVPLTF